VVAAGQAQAPGRGEDLDFDGVAGGLMGSLERREDLRGLVVAPPVQQAAGRAEREFVGMRDRRETPVRCPSVDVGRGRRTSVEGNQSGVSAT
jgi:hypothetical protein